jgi:hypothetical protein|nr:MAG TPA: hypothetical protein [Caudoviricetes sp.]
MARALAKHTGRSLDDVEHLDHARGVRTKDGSYTVALFGAPVRGLVVKHRQIRVTRGLRRLSASDVEDLLTEADRRFEAYWTAVNVCHARAHWIVALKENEIVLSNGRTLRYDEAWKVFK